MDTSNNTGKKLYGLMRLYRLDSFTITTLSYFVTLFIIGGPVHSLKAIILGLMLGCVFVNFIYSLNSYFDARIDAINKPFRPLPSGAISKSLALKYISVLGLFSVLLPIYFLPGGLLFTALYAYPLIAVLYSNPWYPFKKKAVLATLLTTLLLALPAIDALLISHSLSQYWYYAMILFIYCFCLVPLKDIEDVKGDVAFNSGNWAHIAGEKRLLRFSITGLAVLTAVIFFFRQAPGLIYLFGVFSAIICVELYFLVSGRSLIKIYKIIILSNITLLVAGAAGFIIKMKFL